MRRLGLSLAFLLLSLWSPAQTWEKLIAPGVSYRMEVDAALPRVIHALRFAREAPTLRVEPVLADERVYNAEPGDLRGRETLTTTMRKVRAVAGVNADFFPFTGDPLGAMVQAGELVSEPFRNRAVFVWGKDTARAVRLTWQGSFTFYGSDPVPLTGVNESAAGSAAVLNTRRAGFAVSNAGRVRHFVLDFKGRVTPDQSIEAKVTDVVSDQARLEVPPDSIVLTVTNDLVDATGFLVRGEKVSLRLRMQGADWVKTPNAVGGGPLLISQGEVKVTAGAEGFDQAFTSNRHPRTAIGATPQGDVWLVVIDGRQSVSRGATLDETAAVMRRLGCSEAINLDGGGSSTLAIEGLVMNRPSEGSQRPIANAVLLFVPAAAATPVQAPTDAPSPVIKGVTQVRVGQSVTFNVEDGRGQPVPGASVLWSASGPAWIDQAGVLRGLGEGTATVRARVRGQTLSASVQVVAPNPGAPSGV